MYVMATAGHVDHGKSTLVRALTGMEPDRWAEEKRRGLTIDLGFAWTNLPSGKNLAFVDVPGHERFIGNMLAGVGPVGVAMFVVAADEGWQAQSSDHRDAIKALGITSGVIVLTKSDKASAARREEVTAHVRKELASTGLAGAPIVAVSAHTGEGMDDLRSVLDGVLDAAKAPAAHGRLRLWIDRVFSIKGAGTVVTGTLSSGTIRVGERLELNTGHEVEVRGLHSENVKLEHCGPVSRVAVNIRGISADELERGQALLTCGAWPQVSVCDVRTQAEGEVVLHCGTAAVPARVRPLGQGYARITLSHPLALQPADALVLRSPQGITGAEVIDVDPPALTRRGAAARRAQELASSGHSASSYVRRHGAVQVETLRLLGLVDGEGTEREVPPGLIEFSDWWIAASKVMEWKEQLLNAVKDHALKQPLSPGLSKGAAANYLGLPGSELLGLIVAAAKLENRDGYICHPGAQVSLGAAEDAITQLEERLRHDPFAAPEAHDLQALKLGNKELAAAQRAGRIIKLAEQVVLLPSAAHHARALLESLEQPFSASQARQAWGTTRRVAIPLLEYLDAQGITRKDDNGLRSVVR